MTEQEPEKKRELRPRRRVLRPNVPARTENGADPDKQPAEFLYFQVHYQPVPGARKPHFLAIKPRMTERIHEMIRHGQLLFSGGYPTSIGGMWLLKVKNKNEAERLVQDNPAVSCNLVTYRLLELLEPMGVVVQLDRAPAPETAVES